MVLIIAVAVAFGAWFAGHRAANQETAARGRAQTYAAKATGVAMAKELERSAAQRELEIAIPRAERALTDAEEAVRADEKRASESRHVAPELKRMSVEMQASAEASERQSEQSIREIHIADAKTAKARLDGLTRQLAAISR